MYFGEILRADTANGLGMRVTLFVSGCTNHCPGCFQPQTWDFNYGQPYTPAIEDMLIKELSKSYYQGLTLLGGEPFEPGNQREIVKLIRRIRKELPEKDIWAYTGFVLEKDLGECGRKHTEVTEEILRNIDVLVDGKFEEARKDVSLKFRGSANQRIIDMRQTIFAGKIVLSGLNKTRTF